MGGFQSCFSFRKQSYKDDKPGYEPPRCTSIRVRSDEDWGLYIADPDVDSKATELINKFHKKCFMDIETETAV
ncbi:hypothetical protein LUZ62_025198 [Rhynchospora pubera]|uniref:Uncharacterized protein n=1 Tax=Rhynchospora pubera TaxID=906938 RepID=A0AAV8H520_9POAL|nr:hypothetical protein LUZ62_025198 [Rhynchospora pubera]